MMSLAPIDPTITFKQLEIDVCDAQMHCDVLFALVEQHFDVTSPNGQYVLTEQQGARLFFAASNVSVMAQRIKDAFYIAFENELKAQAKGGGA